MTSPHDPEHPSPSSADEETTEVPLVDVVLPDDGQPIDQEPIPPGAGGAGDTPSWLPSLLWEPWWREGLPCAVHYSDSTNTAATTQPQAGPNGAQQQPLPRQGPLGSLGQLDVGQLDGLLNQLSNGKLDSDQLRALLALVGLPDHLDASQLQDLLHQLGGGHLLDGAVADGSSGVET